MNAVHLTMKPNKLLCSSHSNNETNSFRLDVILIQYQKLTTFLITNSTDFYWDYYA